MGYRWKIYKDVGYSAAWRRVGLVETIAEKSSPCQYFLGTARPLSVIREPSLTYAYATTTHKIFGA